MTGPKKNQLKMSLADGTPESGLALWSLSFSRQHLSVHIFSSFDHISYLNICILDYVNI